MLDFLALSTSSSNPTVIAVIYSLLLSFILGTAIAVVYIKTFQGLSYSRNFLHSLILCPIVISIAMQAIGDNVARGIGMVGAISLLRFRTNVKDPRDMFFIFASLSAGLACGVHSYSVSIVGVIGFSVAAYVLSRSPFAQTSQYDGLLRLNLENKSAAQSQLETVMRDACRNFALVTIREIAQGERLDYAYQVKLKRNKTFEQLVSQIRSIDGIKGVNLMLQEATVEV